MSEETETAPGGTGEGTTTADTADTTTAVGGGTPTLPEGAATDEPQGEEPKPYLGEDEPKGEEPKGEEPKGEEPKGEEKPVPATEADYLAAVVKDENVFGKDESVRFDPALVKAVVPAAQELGIAPEAVGKLANLLAKAQMDGAREAQKSRIAYFEEMKEKSLKTYSPQDFAQINAGIDHWFKPGGVMNGVIRSSELGADPEFLALMHYLGSRRVMDSLQGVGDGGGGGDSADPNSTEGLSRIW